MAQERKSNKDNRFWISKDDWNKVISYAESSYHQMKSEIGGQMVVVVDDEGDFILKDPVILKQEVSSGNCEMEAEALAVHYSKMAGKYGDDVRHCWWHSHHTMGAFWSPTDDATILENTAKDFTVSLVVNLKREYKLRVQFFYPFKHEENVTLNFLEDEVKRNNKLDKEVEELCTKEKVVATSYTTYRNGKKVDGYGQTSLGLTAQDEIDDYNMYGYGYSGIYGNNDKLDLNKVPADKVKGIHDRIEAMQDSLLDETMDFHTFKQTADALNQDIKDYNIRVKDLNKEDLERAGYHYWPEDFLENIEGRDTVVHQ
jgi:hypothetical protein